MEKVNLDTIKPWITKRVTELLGAEDDVLFEFIVNMLEKGKVNNDCHSAIKLTHLHAHCNYITGNTWKIVNHW